MRRGGPGRPGPTHSRVIGLSTGEQLPGGRRRPQRSGPGVPGRTEGKARAPARSRPVQAHACLQGSTALRSIYSKEKNRVRSMAPLARRPMPGGLQSPLLPRCAGTCAWSAPAGAKAVGGLVRVRRGRCRGKARPGGQCLGALGGRDGVSDIEVERKEVDRRAWWRLRVHEREAWPGRRGRRHGRPARVHRQLRCARRAAPQAQRGAPASQHLCVRFRQAAQVVSAKLHTAESRRAPAQKGDARRGRACSVASAVRKSSPSGDPAVSSDALLPELAAVAPGTAPAADRGDTHLPPAPPAATDAAGPSASKGAAAAPKNAPCISNAAATLKGLMAVPGAAADVRLGASGAASSASQSKSYGKPGTPPPAQSSAPLADATLQARAGAALQGCAGGSAVAGHALACAGGGLRARSGAAGQPPSAPGALPRVVRHGGPKWTEP